MSMEETVRANVMRIRDAMAAACARSGRAVGDVTLIGVTKSVGRPVADALIAAGVTAIGENRVQDALHKFGPHADYPPLPPDVALQMIGNAQTNKARDIVRLFAMLQSLNRPSLADAVEREAAKQGRLLPVLIEVNVSGEWSKEGVGADEVVDLHGYVANNCPHLRLDGLMTIAPLVAQPEETRPIFRALRELRDRLRAQPPNLPLPILSMGMSNDFPIAIEEGATHIRVGRALFTGVDAQ